MEAKNVSRLAVRSDQGAIRYPDKPGTLYTRTLQLVRESDYTTVEMFWATGIPYVWITRFKQGGFSNPSVNRVQILYEFLTGKSLDVA